MNTKEIENINILGYSTGSDIQNENHLVNFLNYLFNKTRKYHNDYSKFNYFGYRNGQDNRIELCKQSSEYKIKELNNIPKEIFDKLITKYKYSQLKMDLFYFQLDPNLSIEDYSKDLVSELYTMIKNEVISKMRDISNEEYFFLHLNQKTPHFHLLYPQVKNK